MNHKLFVLGIIFIALYIFSILIVTEGLKVRIMSGRASIMEAATTSTQATQFSLNAGSLSSSEWLDTSYIMRLKDTGTQWVRVDISSTDTTSNNYKYISALHQNGFKVLAIVGHRLTPNLQNYTEWQTAINKVMQVYGNIIDAIEVCNEPDLTVFHFGIFQGQSDVYINLLKTVYQERSNAGLKMPIVAGAVASLVSTGTTPGDNYGGYFLSRIRELGSDQYCDAYSFHIYDYFLDLGSFCSADVMYNRAVQIVQNSKPVWVTEMGHGDSFIDMKSHCGYYKTFSNGYDASAYALNLWFTQLINANCPFISWYLFTSTDQTNYNLIDYSSFNPNPSFYTFQNFTKSTSGPIAYWKLDEGTGTTAADNSLNKNNAILFNGPTWVTGKFGKAIQFDGTNDYLEASDSSSLDLSSKITLSAWINPSVATSYSRMIAKSHTSNATPYTMYGLMFDNASHIRLEIASAGAQKSVNGTTTIPLNIWTFIAGTYDGSTMKVYVNGNLDGSVSKTGSIDTNNITLSMGRSGYNTNYYKGSIDEVKIWNRALTADEIKSEYGAVSYLLTITKAGTGSGTVTSVPAGISCGATCSYNFNTGTSVTLTAAPAAGSTFAGWSGACTGTGTCTVSMSAAKSVTATFKASGLVGYWKIDEGLGTTVKDSSGNNISGTISGATWTTTAKSGGKALSFDGNNDYVNLGSSSILNPTQAISVQAWIYAKAYTTSSRIISKETTTIANPYALELVSSNNIKFFIGDGTTETGTPDINVTLLNTWVHVVGTYDGSNIKIYINGVLKGTTPRTGTIPSKTTKVYFGNNPDLSRDFNGIIDEVKIWNRTLTADEILID